jgi:GT2 family glycosyltransferase
MKLVYSIVLNWNQPELTRETLLSLTKQKTDGFKHRILLVENGSEKKASVEGFDVEILNLDQNYGFAKGNNFGIKQAFKNGADYVFVVNNDVLLSKDALHLLFEFMESNSEACSASPLIYFAKGYEFHKNRYKESEKGKVIWAAGGQIDWANVYGSNRLVDVVSTKKETTPVRVDFASGAAVLYRASILRAVGLYDEDYFMYLEDMDLSVRMSQKSAYPYLVPTSEVWHKVSQSSEVGGQLNDYFITRNRLIFGLKYASSRAKFALLREAVKLLFVGRKWQKRGVFDFFVRKYGRGSWPKK